MGGGERGEGARWRGNLRRELAVLLLLKAIALALLWAVFFSPRQQLHVTAAAADARLLPEASAHRAAQDVPHD
jgi:hypothetical protein